MLRSSVPTSRTRCAKQTCRRLPDEHVRWAQRDGTVEIMAMCSRHATVLRMLAGRAARVAVHDLRSPECPHPDAVWHSNGCVIGVTEADTAVVTEQPAVRERAGAA